MSSNLVFAFFFFFLILITFRVLAESGSVDSFTVNGFSSVDNLSLNGVASVSSNGVLQLIPQFNQKVQGSAFFSTPFNFKFSNGKLLPFSTTFVFAFRQEYPTLGGDGMAFVVTPSTNPFSSLPSQNTSLFSDYSSGNSSNHILAIELDTAQNFQFYDIDYNHVGIDINSLVSNKSHSAGYYEDGSGLFKKLELKSSKPTQVWVDFGGHNMQLNVTLAPVPLPKPKRPLLSYTVDFSGVMMDAMFVGFSSSTGVMKTATFVQGWSFKMNGSAEPLDYSKLPPLPEIKTKGNFNALSIWLSITLCLIVLFIVGSVAAILFLVRRNKYAELHEDWELEYGPHRFSYKSLYQATNGFKERELLGTGGFGKVYRGVLPDIKTEVAVKKFSRESRQGMKEFVAEIVSIGKLRHRNLVQLLGYCRRQEELLLVYDFMPNGSLDRCLFDHTKPTLNRAQRFQIIKGVASGLLYLHEDWEQVVIHRDVKASNVLLDSELNGRLGDFGLARLSDCGDEPKTTHIVGTMGYIAPELARTGKATTATDVFAFGIFLLEVVCGRRPIEVHAPEEEMVLMDSVLRRWQKGLLLETRDSRLGEEYCASEVDLVLKLGLLCSNPIAAARPNMRQVVQFIEGDVPLPEMPTSYMGFSNLSLFQNEELDIGWTTVVSISGISGGR